MSLDNKEVRIGQISEIHPDNIYRIETSDGSIIKGYLSGRLKQAKIRVLIGDKVKYEVDVYGNNNRIIRRL